MKKSVLLMAGLMVMAFTGSALAAGTPMFAVQNSAGTTDLFAVATDGSITTSNAIGFNYDNTTGMSGFGTKTPVAALSVTAQTGAATRGLVISQHNPSASSAIAGFRKSRGTEAAPVTVNTGDYIGAFGFKAYDGTGWVQTASFGARINGTIATGSVPTELYFCNNATNLTDCYTNNQVRMLIDASGNIGIGTATTPYQPVTSKLQVVGLPVWPDNATATTTGGLTAGAFYRTATGVLMVAF